MTETGRAVRVVNMTEDHVFVLDNEALRGILMSDEIKDLPVAVVSLAGAFRSGKSFMLDFFLRYLTSSVSARANGAWLGEDTEPLAGFSWRGGTKRETTGILLWSEPIVVKLSSGEKVAVILMDTQGTFDNKSTYRDCSVIFSFSTLLSSVQVYNITGKMIKEDDLQHLQFFTEYGKKAKQAKGDQKPLQVLEFLVRDWENEEEYPFGSNGGLLYLNEVLEIDNSMAKELSDLRNDIRNSFETVSCFLMPHPGSKVTKKSFQGATKDIEPQFLESLKELTTSLFGPQKLKMKSINGRPIKARELFTYFVTYMESFNSKAMPDAHSIAEATKKGGFLSAMDISRELYETGMEAACGSNAPSVTPQELKSVHEREMAAAIATFEATIVIGSTSGDVKEYHQKLEKILSTRLQQFMDLNIGKTRKAVSDAKDAYEKAIFAISGPKPLCLHAADLERLHNEAVNAAIKIFDSNRKSASTDKERKDFTEGFKQRFEVLRTINEGSNGAAASELRIEYWDYMQRKSVESPPLSVPEFADEHRRALQRALDEFKSRRNRPDSYKKDDFKSNLLEKINKSYDNIKSVNQSKNKNAINAGISEYFKQISAIQSSKCLHPDDLIREHEQAKCSALKVFRPKKFSNDCEAGYNDADQDEQTLLEVINQKYLEIKEKNDSANNSAVEMALYEYIQRMDELCRPTLWWLLVIPIITYFVNKDEYHKQSKEAAMELFYSKRRNRDYHLTDIYVDNLERRIKNAYNKYLHL